MFVACPHCGYLVALIVAKDGPARACPRCGGSLQSQAPAAGAEDVAAMETAATEATAVEAATVEASAVEPPKGEAASAVTAPGADAAPAGAAAPPSTPPQAGDEISRSLRRAPAAAERVAAAAPSADAARGDADASRPDPVDGASDGEAPSRDRAPAENAASADQPPAPPAGDKESQHDDDAAPAETALSPLSAAAPAAGRARERQRKSETTVTSARRAPSFARQQARAQAAKPRLHWSGPAAIAALTVALALQLLLAQRAELAADARWRPLVSGLCGALGCAVPPWREPAALTMLNRNVLPVPDRAGVLRVSAGFRNDARWAQPWPVLVLSLEDVDGRRVGQRAFAPGEYRRGYRPDELIAPGQSAAVQFEVIEPAPRVVAFTFDFR